MRGWIVQNALQIEPVLKHGLKTSLLSGPFHSSIKGKNILAGMEC